MIDIIEMLMGLAIIWMTWQLNSMIEYNDKEINKYER